jgi:hypothetical protein
VMSEGGRHPDSASRQDDLYVLGLLPGCVWARRGSAHRSPVAQCARSLAARQRGGRSARARVGTSERSRADVDRVAGSRAGGVAISSQPAALSGSTRRLTGSARPPRPCST